MPEVVRFDRGLIDTTALVQTYDAGVTVDHWATLLPVRREGQVLRHVFRDCAHWWALAENFLLALKEIHQLQLVHLDIKADNVCIPLAPTLFNPQVAGELLFPAFEQIALIDFAFSLVTGERLDQPLPIGAQLSFPYQSPRLLDALAAGRRGDMQPTRELDWRCDMFSLAALLERLLPPPKQFRETGYADGWTEDRYVGAKTLLLDIRDAHDRDPARELPHDRMVESARDVLRHRELAESLDRGWTLAAPSSGVEVVEPTAPLTPLTRVEVPTTHLLAESPPTHLATLVEEHGVAAAPPTPADGDADATPPTLLFPEEPTQVLTVVEEPVAAVQEAPAQAGAAAPVTAVESRTSPDATAPTLPAAVPAVETEPRAPAEPPQPAALPVTEVESRAPTAAPEPVVVPADAADMEMEPRAPAEPRAPTAVPVTEIEPQAPTAAPEPVVLPAALIDRAQPIAEPDELAAAPSATEPAAQIDCSLPSVSPQVVPDEAATVYGAPERHRHAETAPDAPSRRRQRRTLGYAAAAVAAVSLLALIANVASPDRKPPERSVAATRPPAPGTRSDSAGPVERRPEAPRVTPETARSEPPSPTAAASGTGEPAVVQAGPTAREIERPPAPAPVPTPAPAPTPSIATATGGDRATGSDKPPVASKQPDEPTQAAARDAPSDARLMPIPQAATQVDRVLRAAARAEATPQDKAVLETIESLKEASRGRPAADTDGRRSVARRFNTAARDAFWNRRDAAEALALQQKAFDANPLDPEIAGNLAFYHLKVNPPQPESARRVALHALAAAAPQAGARRVEDWGNLAVASALTGRPQDAANALYVMLAVSKDLDRTCRSALSMVASYGPRLKPPVEAMFARIDARGQARGAPYCSWPPRWSAGQKYP